jgi:uncharacterized protein YjeT (DUF2065 family)
MSDLLVGLGLVLVIEGLLWSLAPHMALRLLATAAATPERSLRHAGWLAIAVGVAIVWIIRG